MKKIIFFLLIALNAVVRVFALSPPEIENPNLRPWINEGYIGWWIVITILIFVFTFLVIYLLNRKKQIKES